MSDDILHTIKWVEDHGQQLSNIEWKGVYAALLKEIKELEKQIKK